MERKRIKVGMCGEDRVACVGQTEYTMLRRTRGIQKHIILTLERLQLKRPNPVISTSTV